MAIQAENNLIRYALANREGELQGVDRDSGGYLWTPRTFDEVKLFASPSEMTPYSNELANKGFYIVEVKINCSRA